MTKKCKCGKEKCGKVRYMYTLVSETPDGFDRSLGDYVEADSMREAYDVAVTVCSELKDRYGIGYTVQSVMPN